MGSTVTGTVLVGRLIDRSQRYRRYPIVGFVLVLAGLALLLRLDVDSGPMQVLVGAAVTGFGLGLIMQPLILAIQNAVQPRDLGVATSMSMFSRQFGSAVGLALLGSILNTRLAFWLARLLPEGTTLDPSRVRGRPETLVDLAPAVREAVADAFARSLHTIFLVCVPVAVIGFVLTFMLRELPLREHAVAESPGDDLAIALEGAVIETRG